MDGWDVCLMCETCVCVVIAGLFRHENVVCSCQVCSQLHHVVLCCAQCCVLYSLLWTDDHLVRHALVLVLYVENNVSASLGR